MLPGAVYLFPAEEVETPNNQVIAFLSIRFSEKKPHSKDFRSDCQVRQVLEDFVSDWWTAVAQVETSEQVRSPREEFTTFAFWIFSVTRGPTVLVRNARQAS